MFDARASMSQIESCECRGRWLLRGRRRFSGARIEGKASAALQQERYAMLMPPAMSNTNAMGFAETQKREGRGHRKRKSQT